MFRGRVIILIVAAALSACATPMGPRGVLYQASTITALMDGAYDGDLTLGDLKHHGDFGIGTFDRLDGELLMAEGRIYQIKADGRVYIPPDTLKTPFAAAVFFMPQLKVDLTELQDYESLKKQLDALLPNRNAFYAVRITGSFSYVKTRSVPAQEPPYPKLAEVTKKQPTFEMKNTTGTIVGFFLPDYINGVNVPGYHLHFLSEDRRSGGHLLNIKIESGAITLMQLNELYMVLPQTQGFAKSKLSAGHQDELKAVEQNPSAD